MFKNKCSDAKMQIYSNFVEASGKKFAFNDAMFTSIISFLSYITLNLT